MEAGIAVDRRPTQGEAYFALPGAGIIQVSADFKTISMVETPDEMRKTNLHDTNIWYANDGTPYLVFPANSEGKIYTTALDGKLVHRLDAPTADNNFEQQPVNDYFLGGGNFVPTAVEYMDGLYYITTGYSNLDYVLTAKVSSEKQFEAAWNDLTWGGKGNAIGQFNTGHGITRVPGLEQLDVADRPNARIERFTRYGHFVSLNPMPSGSLPCDVNYLDHQYSVVPALEGPDKKKGAPIYVMEHGKLVSTIMIKEDLGRAQLHPRSQCRHPQDRNQVLHYCPGVESGRLRHPRTGVRFICNRNRVGSSLRPTSFHLPYKIQIHPFNSRESRNSFGMPSCGGILSPSSISLWS